MIHIKENYNNPILYITENGNEQNFIFSMNYIYTRYHITLTILINKFCTTGVFQFNSNNVTEFIRDEVRVSFHREHLTYLHQAIIK